MKDIECFLVLLCADDPIFMENEKPGGPHGYTVGCNATQRKTSFLVACLGLQS